MSVPVSPRKKGVMNDTRITAACTAIDERIASHERQLTEFKAIEASILELRALRAQLVRLFSGDVAPALPDVVAQVKPAPQLEPAPVEAPPTAPVPVLVATPREAPRASTAPTEAKPSDGEPVVDKAAQLLAFIREKCSGEGMTRQEIADATGMSYHYIAPKITRFHSKGLVDFVGDVAPLRVVFIARPKAPPAAPAPAPQAPAKPAETRKALPILGRRVINVEGITVREDLFKCAPLSGTMSAGSCADRQKVATDRGAGSTSKAAASRSVANQFPMCASCSLGRKVLEQLKANEKTSTAA